MSSLVESVRDGVDDRCIDSVVVDIDFEPSLNSVKPLSPPRGSTKIKKIFLSNIYNAINGHIIIAKE